MAMDTPTATTWNRLEKPSARTEIEAGSASATVACVTEAMAASGAEARATAAVRAATPICSRRHLLPAATRGRRVAAVSGREAAVVMPAATVSASARACGHAAATERAKAAAARSTTLRNLGGVPVMMAITAGAEVAQWRARHCRHGKVVPPAGALTGHRCPGRAVVPGLAPTYWLPSLPWQLVSPNPWLNPVLNLVVALGLVTPHMGTVRQ